MLREPNRHLITNRLHWQALPGWPSEVSSDHQASKLFLRNQHFSLPFKSQFLSKGVCVSYFTDRQKKARGSSWKVFSSHVLKHQQQMENFGHIFSFQKGGNFLILLKFPSVIYDHKTYSRNNNKSIELWIQQQSMRHDLSIQIYLPHQRLAVVCLQVL